MRTILGITLGLLVISFSTSSPAQTPEHIWSKGLGGFGDDLVSRVAVDGSGNVVVTGYFQNVVDFGGGVGLVSAGGIDIFVAKYNANGVHQWSKRFGSTGDDSGNAVAVDASGNVFVTGSFSGTVNFGGANLVSTGTADMFLAKYNASGVHQWSQRFGGAISEAPTGVAVDGSGNVVVTGIFRDNVNFGGANLVSAGADDIFLAKYNASGVHQWSQRFGGVGLDTARCVAVDGAGNVAVTGEFRGTVNFGGGDLVSMGFHVFVAKFNASGAHQWSRNFGSTGSNGVTIGLGVAVDGPGNVVVTGLFYDTVDFGGGNLVSAGGRDIFLAKYNVNGVHQWSKRFGGMGNDVGNSVAVDGLGNVVLTGSFEMGVNFGGSSSWLSAGDADIFVAKYNASGVNQYSQGLGGTDYDTGYGVAVAGSGDAVVVGTFLGNVDFGGGVITGSGSNDIFLAKYGNKPIISQISDAPIDQGGHVKMFFMKSAHDAPGMDPLVTQYIAFQYGTVGWEYTAQTPATGATDYVIDAATDEDSTCASGQHWSKFFVRAMTSDPAVFFDSDIDSGYSVDNLPPGIPGHLAYLQASGQLSWDESIEADFDHFTVYGSNINGFGFATFVDDTVTPAMNVASLPYHYYFVTATDHNCNEGNPASIATVTGVGGTPASYVLSVSAYPNPFNPETTIRYTLPTKGRVTIDVFDARGAHVAKLVDAVTPRGAYTVTWNGHDDRGNAVGSGVFFARLTSPAGARSYKMTLLK